MTPVSPADEIRSLAARSTSRLVEVIDALVAARVHRDVSAYTEALADAAGIFGSMLPLADLLGRRRMQLLADHAARQAPERAALVAAAVAQLSGAPSPLLPVVEAREAILDILRRQSELAPGFEAVQDAYAERHAFACARALDVAVTQRIQNVIAATVAGAGPANPRQVIAEIGGWSQAYADTVYVTNVATAYSAGMWARLVDPDVARVLPGAKFVSAKLSTSRPNHVACHGLIAPTDSPIWNAYSPPLGYGCVCGLREVSIFEARREGLLDEHGHMRTMLPPGFGINARPDHGFGRGRPDRLVATGAIA